MFRENNQLVSAIVLGYADEEPNPISRKEFETVVEWRKEEQL